ncbi:zinc ribbon domain-containing protein [Candidatus Latescibacterota bacterium]
MLGDDKDNKNKKKCPFCGKMINTDAIFCRYCGRNL